MDYYWGSHPDGTTYVAAWWPVVVGWVGLVLALVSMILMIRFARGREKHSLVLLITLPIVGFLVGGLVPVIPFLAAFESLARIFAAGKHWASWWEFLPQIAAGTLPAVVAPMLAGFGVGFHLGRVAEPAGAKAAPGWILGVLSGVLVAVALVEAVYLCHIGPLPNLWFDGSTLRAHVGQEVRLTPVVQGEGINGWTPHEVEVDTSEVAAHRIVLRATRPLVEVRREVEFWVARDEPDPLFPLEVGNYWTFQWSSVENSRLLVFIDAGHTYESEPIQATVMREKVVHGLHIYEVEWFDPDFGFEVIEMYNWEGVVHGTPDFPYLQRGQQVTTLEEGGEVRTCTIGFFDDFVCQCLTAPTGNAGIPGPVRCVEVRGGNSDLAVLGSFLMGVLTGGTFIPDFDADVSWQMLESGRIEDPDAWKKDLDWSPEDLPLAECTGDDCPEGADGDGGEQDAGTADGTEEDVTTEGDA